MVHLISVFPLNLSPMPICLNRSLNRRLTRYTSTLQGGARRPRPDSGFGEIFRCFRAYFQVRDRMAREDPHLFGPEAQPYYRETVAEHDWALKVDAALTRVYGPVPLGESCGANQVWSTAYPCFTSAAQKQKWVKNWSRFRKQKSSLPS